MKLWFYFQEETKANASSLAPPLFCFLNSSWPAGPQQKFKFGVQQPVLGAKQAGPHARGQVLPPQLVGSTHTRRKCLLPGGWLPVLVPAPNLSDE